jgi:hypothetical protein
MRELLKTYDKSWAKYRAWLWAAPQHASAKATTLLLVTGLSICLFSQQCEAQCTTLTPGAPVTVDNETTNLPSSRQLVNGTNSVVDTSTAGQIKIDVSSAASAVAPITVDNETSTLPSSRQLVNGSNSTVDTGTSGQIKIDVPASAVEPITIDNETSTLPSSRQLVNGTNTTVNTSTPGQISINATIPSATASLAAGGRLSFSSTLPVPTSDVTSASTIYYLPYTSQFITVDNGSQLVTDSIGTSGISSSISATSGAVYDVFAYDNSGSPALHFVQWTNTTTRATALTPDSLGGFLVLSGTGNQIYRYLGSFYATTSNTSQDEAANRCLFNMYNRVDRSLVATGLSSTWTNSSGTWGSADSNTTNGQGRVSFLVGYVDSPASLAFTVNVHGGASPSANSPCLTGVGLNSTSAPAASSTTPGFSDSANASSFSVPLTANFLGQPALGYNYLQALVNSLSSNLTFNEYGTGTGQTGNMVMVGSAQL